MRVHIEAGYSFYSGLVEMALEVFTFDFLGSRYLGRASWYLFIIWKFRDGKPIELNALENISVWLGLFYIAMKTR